MLCPPIPPLGCVFSFFLCASLADAPKRLPPYLLRVLWVNKPYLSFLDYSHKHGTDRGSRRQSAYNMYMHPP